MSVGHSVTAVFNGVLHPFFIHSGGYAANAAARSGYTSYRPQGAQDIDKLGISKNSENWSLAGNYPRA